MPNNYQVDGFSLPVASAGHLRRFLDGLPTTRTQLRVLEAQGFLVRVGGALVISPPLKEAFERRFPSPLRE